MSLATTVAEDTKRYVRAVLLSKVGGVPMSDFLNDYKNLLGESLNFRELGFSSLQDFIKSMPDAARIGNKNKKTVIFGVGEPNSYMPIGARKAQGKLPKNYLKNLQLQAQEQQDIQAVPTPCLSSSITEMNREILEPDDNGLYSVCVPKETCPTLEHQELQVIFGQAGDVIRTYQTERWVFIRYGRAEDAFRAKELYGEDYDVRIARNKKKEKQADISGRHQQEQNSSDDKEDRQKSRSRPKPQLGGSKNKIPVENGVSRSDKTAKGKSNGWADSKMNGHVGYHPQNGSDAVLPESDIATAFYENNKVETSNTFKSTTVESEPQETGTVLFAANIESEDDFERAMRQYNPEYVRFRVTGRGKRINRIGFAKMKNEADASRAIQDLNGKMQTTKPLILDYDKNGNSVPDKGSPNSHTQAEPQMARVKKKALKMPPLETVLSDMPPLINEAQLGPEGADFHLDCSIFVGNFPSNSLESTLRDTFSKYNVLDICMVNNGSAPGCTKAFLYLATVYDVINAVRDMNSSCVLGYPLKVDVPFTNEVLKAVVTKELSKLGGKHRTV